MVTGVTTNMNPNVLGNAAPVVVPTQLKETPLKSDRRVSVKQKKKKKKDYGQHQPQTWIKRLKLKRQKLAGIPLKLSTLTWQKFS